MFRMRGRTPSDVPSTGHLEHGEGKVMSGETTTIACVLYPGLTVLDLAGPLQVLQNLSYVEDGYRTVVVADTCDPMPTDTPLKLQASHSFDAVPEPDVLLVPGGDIGTVRTMDDPTVINYLRNASAASVITASVCTGSLLLGAAGLLDGRRATSHWMFRHLLPKFGATPVDARWVDDGSIVTAAGVSAGIDLALALVERLASRQAAEMVQRMLEYDPEPPLGPPDWAAVDDRESVERVAGLLRAHLADDSHLRPQLLGT